MLPLLPMATSLLSTMAPGAATGGAGAGSAATVTSGISGATSFSKGGITINDGGSSSLAGFTPLLVVAGVIVLVLFLAPKRRN